MADAMISVTLPDGSVHRHTQGTTVADVAAAIGSGLAKAALAGRIDGKLVDTSYSLQDDVALQIITTKDPEGLEVIRHSTAHLLAQAVKQLFPQAQVTIGPVIENGFYYDFSYPDGFTPENMVLIEQRMEELAKQKTPVIRREIPRDEAIDLFLEMGEHYKAEIIREIPANKTLSLYQQGDFTDLCRGPHVPHTGHLKAFKLMKLAGAYWRGNSDNEMLQRIYGTAWASKQDLDDYLYRLEEAEKRDHRRIAKQQNLFHTQEEAPGMVFWHHNGWMIYKEIEQYLRRRLVEYDYQEIRTPQLADKTLWEKSGHWAKYRENMFITDSEDRQFAIKPMSCPCHVEVFKQGLRSYRELPLRLGEFGSCHRREFSGTLHGLMRVQSFTQDDAHIFCTEEQIASEINALINFVYSVYNDFGFDKVTCHLSTRPEQRVGSDEVWDKAELALQNALEAKGVDWQFCPGDGAFYGPKIDFQVEDCLGRLWQCGTIQLDFQMPGRLGAEYVAEDGSRQVPVMIHRAIIGSFERFMGIFIEHCAGKFPVWLAPIQVAVANISEKQEQYAANIAKTLKNRGVRVCSDLRNEKIGFKIREHTLNRVPFLLVIGDREVAEQQVTVRSRAGEDLGAMSLEQFDELLQQQIAAKV